MTPTVQRWAAVLGIGQWLYFSRGQFDTTSRTDERPCWRPLWHEVAKVYQEMDEYRGAWRRLPCAPATGPGTGTAPVAVAQTVLSDGTPYQGHAPYPVPKVEWLPMDVVICGSKEEKTDKSDS